MEEFTLRDFFKELFTMKKIVCLSVIISVIVCAGVGYYRFQRTQVGDQKEKIETYEKSMKNFDEAIKNIDDNIVMTQKQIDIQQNYLNNALLYKIDCDKVQIGEINYIIDAPLDKSVKIQGLTGVYLKAIQQNRVTDEVKKALPEYKTLFIEDSIITCNNNGNNNGNNLSVRVHHYDMTEVEKILAIVEKAVNSIHQEISIPHTVLMVSKKTYVAPNQWIKKLQIDRQNELKWNKNTLADFKRKYADFQNSKTYYERMNKPVTFVSASPVKTLIKYSVFGVFVGLLWPLLWIFYKKVIK